MIDTRAYPPYSMKVVGAKTGYVLSPDVPDGQSFEVLEGSVKIETGGSAVAVLIGFSKTTTIPASSTTEAQPARGVAFDDTAMQPTGVPLPLTPGVGQPGEELRITCGNAGTIMVLFSGGLRGPTRG